MPTQNTDITEVDRSQPILHQHGYEIQQQVWFLAEHLVDTPLVRS
ncbi:MAG TPA: hypothetical protein VE944_01475 [Nostoc sp.]|nr:hypothetical protein [Nostoc sp.]HYX13043.1 hypothetical protein [Nostoc sp.]